jgi:hypothetical protein
MERMRPWFVGALLALTLTVHAADFATPGGPLPANVDEIVATLRQEPYDLELMISFGTSKGGSAGHLALAIRDPGAADDTVWSANFYADRAPEHAGRYNRDLMLAIPKKEYLFGTASSLGENASFGLDFGELYKRSVIGIRVAGVPAGEREGLKAFFNRLNEDFRERRAWTDYHAGEVVYGYLNLNCAKTIGSAFRYGAGYEALDVPGIWPPFSAVRAISATRANIPTEMAIKLVREWRARGYSMDLVLYKKYPASPYVDPHEEEPVAFKDLPNRFPSVLSRDFRREQGRYEDYDNLFAMYLFYNLGRYSVTFDPAAPRLVIERAKAPMGYDEAARAAEASARADADSYSRHAIFRPRGTTVEAAVADNTHLYDFEPPAGQAVNPGNDSSRN